jgi:hypothetical protein
VTEVHRAVAKLQETLEEKEHRGNRQVLVVRSGFGQKEEVVSELTADSSIRGKLKE